jgi:hypothetical protein
MIFYSAMDILVAENVSIAVVIGSNLAVNTSLLFTFDQSEDDTNDIKLFEAVQSFCSAHDALHNKLETVIFNEYVKARNYKEIPVWLTEHHVLNNFISDSLVFACGRTSSESFGFQSDLCNNDATSAIRSVKLWQAYNFIPKMFELISDNSIVQVAKNWKDGIEGHTFLFHEKVKLLQEIADDVRVETICEIGFNLGHSVRKVFYHYSCICVTMIEEVAFFTRSIVVNSSTCILCV